MTRSVAVLSDIYGVLPALDAVLADLENIPVDRIVVTGDIACGPQPTQVIDRLLELGKHIVWVRGNADRELVDLVQGGDAIHADDISIWAATQLLPAHVALLDSLPHPVVLEIEGFDSVMFCHGTPRDENEIVLVDTGLERWMEVLSDIPSSVTTVVGGHTHMPFSRIARGRLIVNPGSVGLPYGRPGAYWAILENGSVQMRRTLFSYADARESIVRTSGYPAILDWLQDNLDHPSSDDDALEVFGPHAGR